MGRERGRRRSNTLSISLPPELAKAVSDRVRSGLYSSASELIREALRLLLRTEELQRAPRKEYADPDAGGSSQDAASRFATTMELFDLGNEIRRSKLGDEVPPETQARLREWEEEQELGPGLRLAPERLAKLELDG